MSLFPSHTPRQLSLGPLETEILEILWDLQSATVKEIHDRILADPNRDLAYASVTTVLQRLAQKGWLICNKQDRAFRWRPLVSKTEAQLLQAQEQLQKFLAIGNPDMMAAFADRLDHSSWQKLEAIAEQLQSAKARRNQGANDSASNSDH